MNRSSAMASCRRRRAACTAAAGLLVALAGAPVADATTLTSGVLTDKNGHPSAGTVTVFPSLAKTGKWPMLGSATAGADGRFSVEVADPSVLSKYTRGSGRQRVGDYTAWATLADGSTGTWTFSGIVDGRGPGTSVIAPDALSTAGAASAASGVSAPFIRVPADEPPARGRASASAWPVPKDCPLVSTEVLGDDDAWTIVGELNNAYNDGTQATFTYGTAQETSSYIGVATKLAGGEFSIDGETYIRDKGSVADSQARRYARKIRSGFHYKRLKQVGYGFCTGRTYYTVMATSFLGGKQTRKQRGTLDKCVRDDPVGRLYESGGQFHREVNSAVRWSGGVNVFGVGLTTRSGFDRDVQLDYAFRGPPDKAHYICGPDGRQSPMIAGRVFSGGL